MLASPDVPKVDDLARFGERENPWFPRIYGCFFFKRNLPKRLAKNLVFLAISKEMLQFLWEVDVSLRQLRDIVGDPERLCGQP